MVADSFLDLGNPTINWPALVDTATPSVTENVKQQIESVVIGYGVEIKFTLTDTAYTAFTGAISSAKSADGSISVFGSLYGKSGEPPTSLSPFEFFSVAKRTTRFLVHLYIQFVEQHPNH